MFSFSLQVSGALLSLAMPEPLGPRKRGQFSSAGAARANANAVKRTAGWIGARKFMPDRTPAAESGCGAQEDFSPDLGSVDHPVAEVQAGVKGVATAESSEQGNIVADESAQLAGLAADRLTLDRRKSRRAGAPSPVAPAAGRTGDRSSSSFSGGAGSGRVTSTSATTPGPRPKVRSLEKVSTRCRVPWPSTSRWLNSPLKMRVISNLLCPPAKSSRAAEVRGS